ncbi:MAG: hypothetical protein Q9187_000420 [Circinaria calcarea]
MLCKFFYAEQIDAVRRKCGVAERIVESLSRYLKWDSKGGKTKSVFLKTLDDRLVLKFSLPHRDASLPSVCSRLLLDHVRGPGSTRFRLKMLLFYQIVIKSPVTGVEFNWFLLVMEILFYDRSPTRIFDLKGFMRNRRIQSTGEQKEVLLDENMNVMDYSLMIAIDEGRKELVVGIIDCIRTYTWDKKLESWIKDRGKNRSTVTSSRSRFREVVGRYVLQASDCWHQFQALQIVARPTRFDDRVSSPDMKFKQVIGV